MTSVSTGRTGPVFLGKQTLFVPQFESTDAMDEEVAEPSSVAMKSSDDEEREEEEDDDCMEIDAIGKVSVFDEKRQAG